MASILRWFIVMGVSLTGSGRSGPGSGIVRLRWSLNPLGCFCPSENHCFHCLHSGGDGTWKVNVAFVDDAVAVGRICCTDRCLFVGWGEPPGSLRFPDDLRSFTCWWQPCLGMKPGSRTGTEVADHSHYRASQRSIHACYLSKVRDAVSDVDRSQSQNLS